MYATRQDMVNAFGEPECIALTDRAYSGQIDDQVLEDALMRATAEIDTYLIGRYPVPWPDTLRILSARCCDIARYLLTGAGTQCTNEIRLRYEDARRYLEKVAAGQIGLGRGNSGQPVVANGAKIVSFGRQFGRDKTGGGAF